MKPTEEVRIWNDFVTSSFEEHYHCKATTAEFALSEAIDLNGGVQFSNLALLSHAVQWRQEICWYSFLFLFSFFLGGGGDYLQVDLFIIMIICFTLIQFFC